jgi:hypothetical protein
MAAAPPPAEARWDLSRMQESRADVANVTTTREEVVLVFGVQPAAAGGPQAPVELTDRIVLSPYAARRLAQLLEDTLRDYESRFGKLPEQRQQS